MVKLLEGARGHHSVSGTGLPVSDALGSPEALLRAVAAHTVPSSATALGECPEGRGCQEPKQPLLGFQHGLCLLPGPRASALPWEWPFQGSEARYRWKPRFELRLSKPHQTANPGSFLLLGLVGLRERIMGLLLD